MAALEFATALDKSSRMRLGENGNPEHDWEPATAGWDALTQLSFQLVRAKSPTETQDIRERYRALLNVAFGPRMGSLGPVDRELALGAYKLIGHTRDITKGKGERQLAYALVWEMYSVCPALANFAIYSFVHGLDSSGRKSDEVKQYGAWSDIKYCCQAIREYAGTPDHGLIDYALGLIGVQLRADRATKDADADARISLAARWLPKENIKRKKSADGKTVRQEGAYTWQYTKLAGRMFPFAETARTPDAVASARRKAARSLHQLYAPLNRAIGTVQIAMSAGSESTGEWDKLSFGRDEDGKCGHYNVTGATLRRHAKAWRNIGTDGTERSSLPDRVRCAENYERHMAKVAEGGATVRGAALNTYELVRDAAAWRAAAPGAAAEKARINGQWAANGAAAPGTGNMVPVIDVSASMNQDDSIPMFAAIGTGIRIAEQAIPALRNRALTFSENPTWFDLTAHEGDFVSKVQAVMADSNWGGSTNLIAAVELIVAALQRGRVSTEDAGHIVLVVLSDMAIDAGDSGVRAWDATAQARVSKVCTDGGYRPFHFVWWNLSKTEGFPCPTSDSNTTMIAGYNAALLNAFEGKGIEALRNYTPTSMMRDVLDDARLQPLTAEFERVYPSM